MILFDAEKFNMTTNSASKVIPISSVVPIIKMKSQTALSATTMTSSITPTFIPELVTAETGTYFRQFGNATQQTQVDFKRLASLLQQMIDKRKAKKSYITKEEEMKQNVKLKNDSLAGETIRSSFQQNTFSVSDLKPIEIRYHHLNPDSKPENSYAISNRYPNEILASIFITKHKKVNDDMALSKIALPTSEMHTNENPMIYIIRQGSIVQNNRNGYEFVSTITLVVDNGEKILIDTGLSTDINERTWILQRLSELGAPPPSINHVITTHGHPDHSGNTNHFPDAFHYAGRFVHLGTHSYFSRIFETDVEKLTENVYLLKTPGHTSDDISVLINNTSFFGTVIVSGDIFIQKEDMKDSRIWKQLATNEIQQEESRRRLLCLADCIIPGHGSLFRVKSSMKRMLNCPDSY
ncbi:conserved hypothetical protein [Brugia malayi]|uniref:Metallo-beta-lactamase domain-containing protein 1 n=1 Tax=Brugia malayi TaxID=6279 RepID=A0A0K0JE00_BRUMA|nr:uncharacterized protein BM_BM4288 [Brugia malayi]CRZ21801.1 Bm4288 [Brugia malayi]VIO89586.1 conserved hypothetical protein [Brugia malayi]